VGSSGAISAQPGAVNETIPALGFKPYRPQKPAGMRIEQTRADPSMTAPACRSRRTTVGQGKGIFTLSRLVEGSSAEGSAPILWRGHAATGADR
jgi:hypothetical protein